MIIVSHLILFLLVIYIILTINLKYLSKSSVYYIIISLFYIIIYFSNIYIFNDFMSVSYGSDSDYYLKIINDLKEGYRSSEVSTAFDQNKFLHVLIFLPPFYWFQSSILSSIIVFFIQNLLLLRCLTVTDYLIKKYTVSKESLMYMSVLAPLVTISFLRDNVILFFIIEFIYLVDKSFNKYILKNYIYGCISVLSVYLMRPAIALILIVGYLLTVRKQKIIFSFIIFYLVLSIFFFPDLLYSYLGRIIILQPEDLKSIGLDENIIEVTKYLNGGYSVYELIIFSIQKLYLGIIKMLIAPLFTSYLYIFGADFSKDFYFGIDRKLLLLVSSFLYNFIIFPNFIERLYTFIKNFKSDNKSKLNIVILSLVLGIIILYSIKFLGVRSFKIDYIIQFLMLLFISLNKLKYKSLLYLAISFMIFVNLLNSVL